VKKVVLAYSGGLDTSVAVAWLREQYGAEVVTAGERVSIRLDGVDWVELEGLEGEAPFASALLLLPDLPAPVRRSLRDVRGVPRTLRVKTSANAADGGLLEVELGPAEEGRLQEWALRPEEWTTPPEPANVKAEKTAAVR